MCSLESLCGEELLFFCAHLPNPLLVFISMETISLYVREGAHNTVDRPWLNNSLNYDFMEAFYVQLKKKTLFSYLSLDLSSRVAILSGGAWWQQGAQPSAWDTALDCAAELVRHLR